MLDFIIVSTQNFRCETCCRDTQSPLKAVLRPVEWLEGSCSVEPCSVSNMVKAKMATFDVTADWLLKTEVTPAG